MKKIILMVCALFFVSANTNAAVITMDVDNQDAFLDEEVTVTISLSDLAGDFNDVITGFFFDTSVYDFVAGSLTSSFDISEPFGDLIIDDTVVGTSRLLTFFTFGFVSYPVGDYTIASFKLIAKAPGASTFSLAETGLADEFGVAITPTIVGGTLDVTSVSAPSTLAIFGLALAALVSVRRKA